MLEHCINSLHYIRSTPTCVGNTSGRASSPPFSEDHPHMCGEYNGQRLSSPHSTGSPPHVWGILKISKSESPTPRITPTYEGNTSSVVSCERFARDHPHMCGEYWLAIGSYPMALGSPPHVWGKLMALKDLLYDYGITPTCVGKAF